MDLVILIFSLLNAMALLPKGCETVFLSYPRNDMELVSKRVELQCITNSSEPVKWSVTYAGTTETKILYTRGNLTDAGKSKYGIDRSIRGQSKLTIDSVNFSYAGKYVCTEGSFGPKVEAELAVVGPHPLCKTNACNTDNSIAVNDYLWMQCSVGFSGHVNLRMDWTRNSTGNIIRSTVENRNLSVLVIQVNSSDNGETFIFKATFTQENNSREIVNEWNYTVNVLSVLSKSICESSLLMRPRSAIVRVGDNVEFSCRANQDQQVIWGFTSSNTSKDTDFYFGVIISLPFESRYRIENKIRGQHNLIIDSVDLGHAGRYRCVTFGTDSNAIAHLTVLDTVPECWTNTSNADQGIMEHDYLWMWCRVIYTGNMIPIFTWTKNNTQDSITTNTTTSDKRTLPLTTTSSVIAQLRFYDNGAIFKCKITFQLPNNMKENAPAYEYQWTYTANVMYGPRNLSIIRYGDRLECSADANPTPMYKWSHLETNTSTEGSAFMLLDIATSDKNYTLQCTAVNAIGTVNKNITVPLSESDGKSALSTTKAAIIITLLNLAGCVILGLIIGLRKSSCFSNAAGWSSNSLVRALSSQANTSSGLLSPLSSVIENGVSQTTATSANCCSLTDRPTTTQYQETYSELCFDDQPSAGYINQSPTEQEYQSAYPVYIEII